MGKESIMAKARILQKMGTKPIIRRASSKELR